MEMIFCHRKLKAEFPAEIGEYEEKLSEISDPIHLWLKEFDCVDINTGLYLGTSTAGVSESISFWKNALIQSPRFANPANFNWTLSNGPASFLSRTLQVKGPCYTLIGGSPAIKGCFYHAYEDLGTGMVSTAIVSGLDIYNGGLHFCSCLLSSMPGEHKLDLKSILATEIQENYAFLSLIRILDLMS
jgi:hypothetical protein